MRQRRPRPDGTGIVVVLGLCGTGTTIVREDGCLADPSNLLAGVGHSVLLDDEGAPEPRVKAAVPKIASPQATLRQADLGRRRPGRPAGPADPNEELWGSIQSRTR